MLESGFRISDLKNIPVHKHDCPFRDKIALDNTFLLSYSHTIYGINYNRQNYKIPLNSIRDDIKGYIGVESISRPWSGQLKLWQGSWTSTDKNKSYVYVWKEQERNDVNYTPEKFNDLENSYFIIKDCPFPFETGDLNNRDRGEKAASELSEGIAYTNNSINTPIKAADPCPDSNKIVTKSYIDERLASKRIIEVATDFYVRDYDCTYIIRASELENFDKNFKIRFPESFNKRALHNKIEFSILVEGIWDTNKQKWVPAISDKTSWSFFNSEGENVNVVWVNNDSNTPVQISEEYLYENAQYLIFRFETATDSIDATPILETIDEQTLVTDYKTEANYKVFITCENLLYRNSGTNIVNNHKGIALNIGSKDNSVKISTEQSGSTIDIDLSVKVTDDTEIKSADNYISVLKDNNDNGIWKIGLNTDQLPNNFANKSIIEKLPSEIDITSAANKVFWTDEPAPSILVRNHSKLGNEVVNFHLFFIVKENTIIKTSDSNIIWGGRMDKSSPTFIGGRVYHITFTNYYADLKSPFNGITQTARINWFTNINNFDFAL